MKSPHRHVDVHDAHPRNRPTPEQERRCQIVAEIALVAFIGLAVTGAAMLGLKWAGILDTMRGWLS
jgi:hypothetical protein